MTIRFDETISDVYDVYMTMIRKQLYIDPSQDAALKRKARELGLSEAELVRRALDAVLTETPQAMPARPSVLQALLEDAQALAITHPAPENYVFKRDDAYEDESRLERWGN
jgi:hypothetical protein